MKVVALVEPKSGEVRAFRVANLDYIRVRSVLMANVDRKSTLVTDEARIYSHSGKEFSAHETVNHSKFNYKNDKGFTTTMLRTFSVCSSV